MGIPKPLIVLKTQSRIFIAIEKEMGELSSFNRSIVASAQIEIGFFNQIQKHRYQNFEELSNIRIERRF